MSPHNPDLTPEQRLAQRVIHVLDAQKKYFKTRDHKDLVTSKEMEKDLRTDCEFMLGMVKEVKNPKQGSML